MWPVSVTRPPLELAGFRRPWTRGRPSAHAVVGRLVGFCVWPSRGCGNVFVAVAVVLKGPGAGAPRSLSRQDSCFGGCEAGPGPWFPRAPGAAGPRPAAGRGEAFGPHDAPPRLVLSIAVFSARHRPRVRSNVSVLLASGSGFFTSEADTGNRLGSVGGRGRHNSSRGDPVDGAAFLAPRWGSRGPRPCVRLPACGHVPWDVTCSPPPSKPVNGSSFPFVFQECRVRCSS